MSWRSATLLLAGFVLGGFLVACSGKQTPELTGNANAQPAPTPVVKYEYTVVDFADVQGKDCATDAAAKINKMAEDSWEYCGPLTSATMIVGIGLAPPTSAGGYSMVLFRRPKKA